MPFCNDCGDEERQTLGGQCIVCWKKDALNYRARLDLATERIESLETECQQFSDIVDDHLHKRKCHQCGHVIYVSNLYDGPTVRCEKCNSLDIRIVTL